MEKNKFLESLKLGLMELWSSKWKILFLGIYIILISYFIKKYIIFEDTFLKNFSNELYPIVKDTVDIFFEESNFTLELLYLMIKNIFYGLVWFLAFLGLLKIVIFVGMAHSTGNTQNKISNVKFPDGLIPKYKGKKKDKKRRHGKKLIFECEGLIKDDYVDRIPRIESALRKNKIYRVLQDNLDKAIVYLYCIPNKYARPMTISKDTNFLDIFLINMLLTGSTGSGKSTALLTLMQIFSRTFENAKITLISYKPTEIFVPFRDTKNYYEFERAEERNFKGLWRT